MNQAKKIFISLGVAALVVCFGIVLLFNWSVTGWKALSVPTGSMNPAIPPGSLALMHSVPNSSIKVGDVITYANPKNMQSTITHRVIKTYKISDKVPAYIAKGDANPTADPIPVVGGQVKGKIIGHIPYVGTWLTWGKGWPAIILMVYIPALIIIMEQVVKLARYYNRFKFYRAPGFQPVATSSSTHKIRNWVALVVSIGASFLVIMPVARALIVSNQVSLAPNHLTVKVENPNPPDDEDDQGEDCDNNNNVSINSNSNQSATSGSATVSNNTSGGTASSGSASNSNTTSVNVDINNNCQD